MVENANHYRRDASLGEDASRIRARHHLPDAQMYFMMCREDTLHAILSST